MHDPCCNVWIYQMTTFSTGTYKAVWWADSFWLKLPQACVCFKVLWLISQSWVCTFILANKTAPCKSLLRSKLKTRIYDEPILLLPNTCGRPLRATHNPWSLVVPSAIQDWVVCHLQKDINDYWSVLWEVSQTAFLQVNLKYNAKNGTGLKRVFNMQIFGLAEAGSYSWVNRAMSGPCGF